MKGRFFNVYVRGMAVRIFLEEVNYIERRGRKIKIDSMNDNHITYDNMQRITAFLDRRFYLCLDGLIINFDKIANITDQQIQFVNGEQISFGIYNFRRMKKAYRRYLEKMALKQM